ncbi:glycine cleavage system aminomethyltransferase GcvT [Exiguobacterium sp. B2(2022)]|uniref:glycine cleavage system aminomethyltransferase GcvT n=1 Tax=Exiguobacterium sp. B2(2022) TaxID=2992755 RepID=UPI00237B27D6|nr:glycine cleavage system aminomethyltransferase GcvT [Exiguobacterium sp. B2(2022)]MDE0563645.1 glycine cleavage system aminomethyltransferase GcvT [Exiguobacterium sp. B2(2022)]
MEKVTLKRTPLFELIEPKAKMVDFAGFEMPIMFSSIKEEHQAVRQNVGMFDVSHMGEIRVEGPDALEQVQNLVTNDVSKIKVGQAQYNLLCLENGGVVDDLLVYRLDEDAYWLVVNASNIDKDEAHIRQFVSGDVTVTNESDEYGQIAIQGPNAEAVLQTITNVALDEVGFFKFINGDVAGVASIISRSGYTGEDGFEIYARAEGISAIWEALDAEGVTPCGLGSRDTLRFEACLPLYGHELDESVTPFEANLNFAVKLDTDFIGKEALATQKENIPNRMVGLRLLGRGIARQGAQVEVDGNVVGVVTTGTRPPTVNESIAWARVDARYKDEERFVIDIRGKKIEAERVPTPFYKRTK